MPNKSLQLQSIITRVTAPILICYDVQSISYCNLDPVYIRENETVLVGVEQSHATFAIAKRFQMAPEVIATEEECVLNH